MTRVPGEALAKTQRHRSEAALAKDNLVVHKAAVTSGMDHASGTEPVGTRKDQSAMVHVPWVTLVAVPVEISGTALVLAIVLVT